MDAKKHTYTRGSIGGGHECGWCGAVNSCFFYGGYYFELADGQHEHHETIECEDCGYQEEIVWLLQPTANTVKTE